MKVGIHANMCDEATGHLPGLLRQTLNKLSARLQGNYGGTIEHLWIDLELIESHARVDGRPAHSFRFAKRVSGRAPFGLPPSPDSFNVGHYSVRPDFHRIASLAGKDAISYALSLIYDSTTILLEKRKKLGGFDADRFRVRFLEVCRSIGYEILEPKSDEKNA